MPDAMTAPATRPRLVVGITGASLLMIRLGWGVLPGGVRYSHLLAAAMLAGIGFTISLFIAELAFTDPAIMEQAKIGILAGSLVAARPMRRCMPSRT